MQSGLGTPEGWPQGVAGRVSKPGYSSQEAAVGCRAHLVCHLSGRPLPTPGSNQSGSSPGRQRLCAPPPNSYSEILTTPVRVLGGGAVGRRLGHEDRAPRKGISALTRDPTDLPHPSTMGEHPKKTLSVDQETHNTGPQIHLHLYLDPPVSMMRRLCLLFKPLQPGVACYSSLNAPGA